MNATAAPTASPTPPHLTGAERRRLRAEAHRLEPIVALGRQGLSDAFLAEVSRALDSHELIKIKVAAEREERALLIDELAQRLGCAVVAAVGKVAVLYRPAPDDAPASREAR